jgi:hypothetical protein
MEFTSLDQGTHHCQNATVVLLKAISDLETCLTLVKNSRSMLRN